MKIKKILCLALAAIIVLGVAGCDKKEAVENTELTWFIPTSDQQDADLVMEKVSEITKEKLGVSVKVNFIDVAAYGERMTMNMASGNEFDLCFTGYVNPYISAVDNGGLMELDELLKNEAPTLLETMPDYAWDVARVNGKVYAVPNLQGFAPQSSLYLYNDLLEKYNFDVSTIKHVEDIEPFLKLIKENEPNLIPYRTAYGLAMWTEGKYEEITSGLYIRCDGSSPEVLHCTEIPEWNRAVNKMHEWYEEGYIRSDILSAGSDIQDLNAGKYAVNQSGCLPGAEVTAKQNTGRDIKLVPIMEPYMSKSKSLAAMTGIGRNSKQPEKAIKLIELVNTDKELLNLLCLGIKDKHYTLDESGKYEKIQGSGYDISGAWLFGNQFNQILAVGQEDTIWEETAKLNIEAVKSPILGFVLDTTNIKTEISQIAGVNQEYNQATLFIKNFAQKDEYMDKLKKAGLDTLKAEVQRQINEYWKTK